MKEHKTSVRSERAMLVALITDASQDDFDNFSELSALADTAGAKIVDTVSQRRSKVAPQYYIGKGKVEEIAERAREQEVEMVIFDNDLTPGQIRNLEEAIECKVIDRSELILDIFATHAKTLQASLQVELAQLQYTYPRLRHMWSHLGRIAGAAGGGSAGAVGGIGTRGPGEKQLEVDRRLVRKRVDQLRKQLSRFDRRKLQEVSSRNRQFTVCLVGYTNAGKSTLMNALTDAGVYTEDKLFATLDTRTRKWDLGAGLSALLSDTVGFIRNLPHHLVASFRATLEEALNADLLLHVLDASDPKAEKQFHTVQQVLKDLKCDEKNVVTVLNKADQLEDNSSIQVLETHVENPVIVSAKTGVGLDKLADTVREYYLDPPLRMTLDVRCEAGKLMNFLRNHAEIYDTQYIDSTARMDLAISADWVGPMRQFAGQFKVYESSDPRAAEMFEKDTAGAG